MIDTFDMHRDGSTWPPPGEWIQVESSYRGSLGRLIGDVSLQIHRDRSHYKFMTIHSSLPNPMASSVASA